MSEQDMSVLALEQPIDGSKENGSILNYIKDKLTSFNKGRLFVVYLDTIFTTFNESFLHKYFGVLGLIYIFRLGINLFAIGKETFKVPAGEKKLTFEHIKANFKNAIADENRLSEIANDAVWFSINLACFLVNPFISIVLTVVGCCFDAINEAIMLAKDRRDFNKIRKMKMDLEELEKQRESTQTLDGTKKLDKTEPIEKQINNLKKEISELESKNHDLVTANNTMSFLKKPLYNFARDLCLSVGLALCLFPPTVIVGAFTLCAGLTLWAADVISSAWDDAAKSSESEKLNIPKSQGGSTRDMYEMMPRPSNPSNNPTEAPNKKCLIKKRNDFRRLSRQSNCFFPQLPAGSTYIAGASPPEKTNCAATNQSTGQVPGISLTSCAGNF